MNIDVHAHFWTDEYLDIIKDLGKDDTDTQRGLGAGGGDELAERLKLMDKSDVDMQILSANPQMPYSSDKEKAVHAARFVNDQYAKISKEHPKRFRFFVAVPLPDVDAAIEEIRRGLDELGALGVSFNTTVMDKPLTSPEFQPVFEELDRRGAVVYIHPAGCSANSGLIKDHKTWMIGAPVEDTVNMLDMIQKGYQLKYPNIKFIISHLGGAAPMMMQRWDNQIDWEAPDTPEKPSVAAKKMWYDSVGHGHIPALKAAVDTFGVDRILLGTDFPYESGEIFTRAITYIKEALGEEDAIKVLSTNAEELFFEGKPEAE